MIQIEIRTSEKEKVFKELTNSNLLPKMGETYQPNKEIELIYLNGMGESFLINDVITFIIDNSSEIFVGLISSYIYDKLKNYKKTTLLIINGKEIEINKKEIEKILKTLDKK